MRLKYSAIASEGFAHFVNLLKYNSGTLEEPLLQMVYLRVSQINGCPYCVDEHWKEAGKAGVEYRKLNALTVWRDTPFFSDRERAALRWAEAVTRLERQEVDDTEYEAVKGHFSEKELVDLTFAISNMNAMNRVAIAFHLTPRE